MLERLLPDTRDTFATTRPTYQQRMPALFLVWVALTVLAPHPDLYKAWFHLACAIPILVLLCRGRLELDTSDALWKTSLGLLLYTAINSLLISTAGWQSQGEALRWCLESGLLVLFLFIALPPLLRDPLRLGRFLVSCALTGSLAGLLLFGLFEQFQGRLSGLGALSNPIQAASTLSVYLAMGAFLMWHCRHRLDLRDQWLFYGALVLTLTATLLSGSRGPILALLVTLGYTLLVSAISHRAWKTLATVLVLIAGAALAVIWAYGTDDFTRAMLARGASYRLILWSALLEHLPDSILFGHGAATDLINTEAGQQIRAETGFTRLHAHNLFIGTFVKSGLMGLTLLLTLFGLILRALKRAPISRAEKWHLLGLLGLVVMLSLTNNHTLAISVKAVWLYTWLPLVFLWLWLKSAHNRSPDHPSREETP